MAGKKKKLVSKCTSPHLIIRKDINLAIDKLKPLKVEEDKQNEKTK